MAVEHDDARSWASYCRQEIHAAHRVLARRGLAIDDEQVHLGGERFLAGAWKLVLTGQSVSSGTQVIAKFSSRPDGMREIQREHRVRASEVHIDLAAFGVCLPAELLYECDATYAVSATAYVRQSLAFQERPHDEQLAFALRALAAQESVRLDDRSRISEMSQALGVFGARDYCDAFAAFRQTILGSDAGSGPLAAVLDRSLEELERGSATIGRYGGVLTHADFAPHNMRIAGERIYLLDHASFHFGNAYESWARFINYEMLRSRTLEAALLDHVTTRGAAASLSLRLMRAFKAGFFLQLYAGALGRTVDDLHALCRRRVAFWSHALEAILDGISVPEAVVCEFVRTREMLRTTGEHHRQAEIQ